MWDSIVFFFFFFLNTAGKNIFAVSVSSTNRRYGIVLKVCNRISRNKIQEYTISTDSPYPIKCQEYRLYKFGQYKSLFFFVVFFFHSGYSKTNLLLEPTITLSVRFKILFFRSMMGPFNIGPRLS